MQGHTDDGILAKCTFAIAEAECSKLLVCFHR